jgi:predicted flap endonuclease-1-like 5' DNA nuclease
MSFLLLQILLCLFIAGLIGAVIGWYLRGNCSKKLLEHDEECEMKMRAIEREWNTKLNYSDDKEPHVYHTLSDEDDIAHAGLKNQVQEDFDSDNQTTLFGAVASALGTTGDKSEKENLSTDKDILSEKKIQLSDEKIKFYSENNIDFNKSEDLEDDYDIQVIEGINSKYAQRFKDLGIHTTKDLIKKLSKNYEDIDFVAKKLKVQPDDITSWISMADIISLPGLNAKEAQLIHTVGISSVRELGVVNIHALQQEMEELNKKLVIVDKIPDLNSLELWAKVAKFLG